MTRLLDVIHIALMDVLNLLEIEFPRNRMLINIKQEQSAVQLHV